MTNNRNSQTGTQGGFSRSSNSKSPNTANSGSKGGNKLEIRVIPDVSELRNGTANAYKLLVEVSIFQFGQPLENLEVVLREGLSNIDTKVTDTYGTVILEGKGVKTSDEQTLNLRICLAGRLEERSISVKIPAIKKTVLTKKTFVVKSTTTPDPTTGKCTVNFECRVFEDGDKPFVLQPVFLKEGLTTLQTEKTDNNGQATFSLVTSMSAVEKIHTYRFGLVGFPDEEEVNVVVPAGAASGNEDPTDLYLMSHGDGKGNFQVKIRVLKMQAVGLAKKPVAVWYKGVDYQLTTDDHGECVFDVPGTLDEGDKEYLTATVSGISHKARICLRRRKELNNPKAFTKKWWLGINNGRAFILSMITILFWVAFAIHGFGGQINVSDMFRDNKTHLSPTEEFYQSIDDATGGEKKDVAQPWKSSSAEKLEDSGFISGWNLLTIALILLLATAVYVPLSAREEIWEAISETVEKLFDNPSDHAGDPALERLAQMIGAYSVVRRQSAPEQAGKTIADNPDQPGALPEYKHKDNSVLRFIGIDLAMEVALSALSKVFKK